MAHRLADSKDFAFFLKKIRFALAYVRKKQYLCREKCSFANMASEIIRKNAIKHKKQHN